MSVNLLTPAGQPTGTTIVTKTTDSVGNFTVGVGSAGPVQITAEGYHYNELTGRLSDSTLTLRGVYEVTAESQQVAYVNVLTHLISNRVLKLMGDGMKVGDAIDQAQKELLTALKDVIPAEQIAKFTSLSVYDVNGTESSGDAYLLALSATVYQDATDLSLAHGSAVDGELTLLLNNLAVDLEDNGVIDDAAIVDDLKTANSKVVAEDVVSNLKNLGKSVVGANINVPNIDAYTDHVLITAPANSATVVSNTQIKFAAPVAVEDATYQLLVDGEVAGTLTQSPYQFDWNPYFWSAGAHTLLVQRVAPDSVTLDSNLVTVNVASSVVDMLQATQPETHAYLDSGSDVTLGWNRVMGAASYDVQIAREPSFSSLVSAQSTVAPNLSIGKLLDGPYYWRFRALDSQGMAGAWSSGFDFGIGVFSQLYVTPQSEYAQVALQTSDGGYAAFGYDSSAISMMKVDSAGKKIWSQKYVNGDYVVGSSFIQTKDGGFIIAGATSGVAGLDGYVIKVDGNGVEQWSTVLDDVMSGRATGIADAGDGYLVTLSSYTNPARNQLVSLDGQGNELWRIVLFDGKPEFGQVTSLEHASDGGYLIAGTYNSNPGGVLGGGVPGTS